MILRFLFTKPIWHHITEECNIHLRIYYAESSSNALLDSPFSVLVLCGVSLAQLCLSPEANTP